MTIELKPEETRVIDRAIQAGLIVRPDEVVGVGVEALRSRLESRPASDRLSRQEAIRRMQDFGDTHKLSLAEPITREVLHDGHRY